MKHLESRSSKDIVNRDDSYPEKENSTMDYYIDFKSPSQDATTALIKELEKISVSLKLLSLPSANSPWFPRHISELRRCCTVLFRYGAELGADHLGYGDMEYVQRRRIIAEIAKDYK